VCDVREHEKLAAKIATAATPAGGGAARPWDRRSALGFGKLVRAGLALTAADEAQLARDGFVVPARLEYAEYASAYSDIHRGQLPVFVSIDSVLHAVYASHDVLLSRLERAQLVPRLDRVLGAMHCALAAAAGAYPKEVASDVDFYLTVARSLLAGQRIRSELGPTDAVDAMLALLGAPTEPDDRLPQDSTPRARPALAKQVVELFGRTRNLDATMFAPRGHYANDEALESYFRAAMWLSRLELNLVSRDNRSSHPGEHPDPRETPREAAVALALADLAERSGALADLAAIDRAWASFGGRREDVSPADLVALRKRAGIGAIGLASADRLRAAIGDRWQRTVNVHPMARVARLPAIATMIGPRITPETLALEQVMSGRSPQVEGAELAFVLGQDRALAHVRQDPALERRLRTARATLAAAATGDDLYDVWLGAIRKLSTPPVGAVPSFMATPAYADLRVGTTLAAFGQLRHNHVLLQAQNYEEGGCEIPDGYVEPAIATYEALVAYAARGRQLFADLDAPDHTGGAAYFTRLEGILKALLAIARAEVANAPLSEEQKRFLSMIVEVGTMDVRTYAMTIPVATHDGWYFDLYPSRDTAFKSAAFVADYLTFDVDPARRGIHYLGAKGPRLGVFAVDTGGAPRLMVGPVARAFEHTGPLDRRLSDDDAPAVAGRAPWAASYTVAAPPAPSLSVRFHRPIEAKYLRWRAAGAGDGGAPTPKGDSIVHLHSDRDLGTVQIDFLDHHFVQMATASARVGGGATVDVAAPATPRRIEALRVRHGAFSGRVDLDLRGAAAHEFTP
ncbi:MAG: DUF3160 domain-containing protein, partial [Deltaproteobacteria bacterium]|nr:DUF3160 domain-containing protein [Deltaproteobacteria bacterium]